MEFSELIHKRESVRDFDPDRPVERAILLRILEAGRAAPSAANRQPWRFLVAQSEPLLSRIKSSYQRDWLQGAKHIVVAVGSKSACWKRADGYLSIETDLAIAMDHIVLAAANDGVGSCWIQAFDPAVLNEALELKEDQVVFAFTPLGYPHAGWINPRPKSRKVLDEVVEFR